MSKSKATAVDAGLLVKKGVKAQTEAEAAQVVPLTSPGAPSPVAAPKPVADVPAPAPIPEEPEKRVKISVALSEEMYEQLRNAAFAQRRKHQAVMVEALEAWLKKHG